ncbi:lactoylglutathione lyase [Malassezia caprae]|uniref:Aldoketomutase n=1 Tax=Malassezia caprae TaxID=1381934 RepID=A0AAF0E582_9BASI|nr:lactoylglutathione lyase [Malassezia caprae]
MFRVKDPKASLDFYENVLGMDLIDKLEMSDFTLYFLGYQHQGNVSRGEREALLELTHNHGTENDPDFHYHNGNAQPQGFGHLAISVDDIEAACARFERLGVKFQKRLTDNYWIEIISAKSPQ